MQKATIFHLSTINSRPIGAGGIRTPAGRVKSSLCCRYTTTPCEGVATFVCQIEFHDDLIHSRVESTNSRLMGMSLE